MIQEIQNTAAKIITAGANLFIYLFIYLFTQDTVTSTVTVGKDKEEVPIKHIHVQDNTNEIEVTLWREHTTAAVKTGDYDKIKNASVGYFDKKKNLSTQAITTIEVGPLYILKLFSIRVKELFI